MRIRNRGIVIVSVLVLTLLATFFLGALIQMNPSRLRKATHSETRERAVAAAHAGIDYALHRLHEDLAWRADANAVVVQTDDLVILEDQGNVLGWIRSDQGPWSHFRLRFNYQDGTEETDGYPAPQYPLDFSGISLNNMTGPSSVPIPLGNGPSFAYAGSQGFDVPEFTIALLVEGVVGPGLEPGQPQGQIGGQALTRRVVEGIYQVAQVGQAAGEGAVLMASGDSEFTVRSEGLGNSEFSGSLRLAAQDQVARMRTKGSSTLDAGQGNTSEYLFYPDMHSEVAVGVGGFSPTTKSGQEFSVLDEADDPFLEVAWHKVAQSEQEDRISLPAGVYTFEQATGTSNAEVKYFPMSWQAYRETRLADGVLPTAELPPAFAERVQLNGKSWTDPAGVTQQRHLVTFERDVEVVSAPGNVSDLVIVPARGARPALEEWGIGGEREEATKNPPGDEGFPDYQFDLLGPPGSPPDNPPDNPPDGLGFSSYIPSTDSFSDITQPQDIEVVFAPEPGSTAAIRALDGNVFLGTHLSGSGGAIVAGKGINLVGFGVDLHAGLGERDGIALYAQDDIRISTFDEARSKYWDAAIKGVIFTKGDLLLQLGENSSSGSQLPWGSFDYMGSIIALGKNTGVITTTRHGWGNIDIGDSDPDQNGGTPPDGFGVGDSGVISTTSGKGDAKVIAQGIRLFYEPKFLAPYMEENEISPTFAPVSVYVR